MKTGVNTSTIIDISKKRKSYLNKGNTYCIKCKYLMFGYYCSKRKGQQYTFHKESIVKFYEKDMKYQYYKKYYICIYFYKICQN